MDEEKEWERQEDVDSEDAEDIEEKRNIPLDSEDVVRRIEEYMKTPKFIYKQQAVDVKIFAFISIFIAILVAKYFANDRADVLTACIFLVFISFLGLVSVHLAYIEGMGAHIVLLGIWLFVWFIYAILQFLPVQSSSLTDLARSQCEILHIRNQVPDCFNTMRTRLLVISLCIVTVTSAAMAFMWRCAYQLYVFASRHRRVL